MKRTEQSTITRTYTKEELRKELKLSDNEEIIGICRFTYNDTIQIETRRTDD